MEYLQLLGGLVLLIFSGKYLVKSGVALALHLRLSMLVIGITIVAFGTSAPELIVSANAVISGHPEIAIGNVIGSNISNIALVLAVTSIIIPIPVNRTSLRIDWPVMMLAFVLLYFAMLNGTIQRWESAMFVLTLIGFIIMSLIISRRNQALHAEKAAETDEKAAYSIGVAVLIIVASSVGLAVGSDFMVDGASHIARNFGVSERIISITVIAFGTSIPELTASVIAAINKQTDISIGNIIGSNIFNVLAVLGISGLITPIDTSLAVFRFDILIMLLVSVFLFLFIFPFQTVYLKRYEGVALFFIYLVYMALVVSDVHLFS